MMLSPEKKDKYLVALIGLFFCSTALTNVISLPMVKEKVQFSELLFLPILALGYRYILNSFREGEYKKWYLFLPFLYVCINLISSFMNGGLPSILESFGKVYLFLFYWITLSVFRDFSESDLKAFLYKYATILSVIVSFICVFGFLCFHLIGENRTGVYEFYPYLGNVFRTYGLTRTPGMLISVIIIVLPILMLKRFETQKKSDFILSLLSFVVALFTFSKSNIFLYLNAFVLFFSYYFKDEKAIIFQKATIILLISTFLIFNIATHFLLVNAHIENLENYKTSYISDRIVGEIGQYSIYETPYSALKRAALIVFQQHPLLGVGTGNFDTELSILQQKGLYPTQNPIFNPHSTFTGALAENGVFGFLALSLFLFFMLKESFINKQKSILYFTLFLCLFTAISEDFVADTMNFRHFWFLFAIVIALNIGKRNDVETQNVLG